MNDIFKVRSAAVSGDGRTLFRFEASTWADIDMVAEQAGMSWVDWADEAIKSRPHAKSKVAAVRAALSDALMSNRAGAISLLVDQMLVTLEQQKSLLLKIKELTI